jgi:hypothetical protein
MDKAGHLVEVKRLVINDHKDLSTKDRKGTKARKVQFKKTFVLLNDLCILCD